MRQRRVRASGSILCAERTRLALGRTDAFKTALRLRVLLWSVLGAFLGFLMGVCTVAMQGTGYWVAPVTTVMGWAISYFGPLFIAHVTGLLASTVHAPSGASIPRRKEY